MKAIRIFLLVLIIIGIGLIASQGLWIPKIDAVILGSGNIATVPDSVFKNGVYGLGSKTFALSNGKSQILNTPMGPFYYSYGAGGSGDINGAGEQGSVVALYQDSGANLISPVLFVFMDQNGVPKQIGSLVLDQPQYEDAAIQSVSIGNKMVTLNLLVISSQEQQLPHYQQRPTQPVSLNFTLSGGTLIQAE